jgi:hypothetical protein
MYSKPLVLLLLLSTAAACSDDGWSVTIERGESASGSEVDKLPTSWSAQDDPHILDFENDFITLFDSLPTEGQAATAPWAGSYWPTHEDSINYRWDKSASDTLSPAAKFEKAFGREGIADSVSANFGVDSRVTATVCTKKSDCDSKKSEVCAKREGASEGRCIETWFGICHAWAPAAAMTDEPKRAVMHNGVEFKINDIKALVSLSYTSGLKTRFLSKRCNAKNDGTDEGIQFDEFGVPTEEFEECADTNAGTFHVVAANYLGIKKKAFVEDRTFDYQVWNQPVMGFEVKAGFPKKLSATQANTLMSAEGKDDYLFNSKATQWRHLKTTVSYISESPSELDGNLNETIHTYTRKDHYEYILELDSVGHVIGGEWIGSSKKAHPDFLWAPEKKSNTEVAPPHLEIGSEPLSVAKETWAFLDPIDVTPGESLRVVMKSNRAKGEQGNADLFVNFMTKPSTWSSACSSRRDGSAEVCDVSVPWNQHVAYIGVLGVDEDDVQVTTSRVLEGTGISWKEVEMLLDRSLTLEDAPDTFDDLGPGSFDWGDTCEGGFADLKPTLTDEEVLTLGLIPTGMLGVRVTLSADAAADLVVYDKISGTAILGPEDALLKSGTAGCVSYYGATYCADGAASDTNAESFEVQGVTTRELVVRLSCGGDGEAVVDYLWGAQPGCESVLSESFEYELKSSETLVATTVPQGAENVLITLTSDSDIDLQLFEGETPLVYWAGDDDAKGLLSGADPESAEHEGLSMTYSGFSGTDTGPGHEFIKLQGTVPADLEVRVFGYQSGSAQISVSSGLPDDQVASEL